MLETFEAPQRDDRRRRVLGELIAAQSVELTNHEVSRRRKAGLRDAQGLPPRSYPPDTLTTLQPRITDLISRYAGVHLIFFLAGLVVIGAILWLHLLAESWRLKWGVAKLAAIDLENEPHLASWFSAVVFLLTAWISWVVYQVRRFRKDDYQGRYRIWIWATAIFVAVSVEISTNLHHLLIQWLGNGAKLTTPKELEVWWSLVACLVMGGLGIRLFADMTGDIPGRFALFGAAVCYLSTTSISLLDEKLFGVTILSSSPRHWLWLCWGINLLGHWLVLTAVLAHARFVILDAQRNGQILSPGEIGRSSLKAESLRIHTPHQERQSWHWGWWWAKAKPPGEEHHPSTNDAPCAERSPKSLDPAEVRPANRGDPFGGKSTHTTDAGSSTVPKEGASLGQRIVNPAAQTQKVPPAPEPQSSGVTPGVRPFDGGMITANPSSAGLNLKEEPQAGRSGTSAPATPSSAGPLPKASSPSQLSSPSAPNFAAAGGARSGASEGPGVGSGQRKLTKEEKKALRRRLEQMREARENQRRS